MSVIIQRSNGVITQEWQNNQASWASLSHGFSKDVQWKKTTDRSFPKQFKSKGEAEWYLRKRLEKLEWWGMPKDEGTWTYSIVEVE